MSGSVAVVMSGFPRVSETFALGELSALAEAGQLGGIFATKPGDMATLQPEAGALLPYVHVLSDTSPKGQSAEVAQRLSGQRVAGIHGYFAHTPAAVAEGAADLLGIPFSFGAHALDARKVEAGELARRATTAACVMSCNADTAEALRNVGAQVTLLPHGVDLSRFRPSTSRRSGPVRVLAVGRLVEKKGFEVLIEALSLTSPSIDVRIVGEGPQRPLLEAAIRFHGLNRRVTLVGRRTHEQLPDEYAWADIVAVPSVVDSTGDRDGLPNVLLEAFASACAVVAADAGAISVAVRDGVTGLLVPARSPRALAGELERLAADPSLRERLGLAGRQLVTTRYDRTRQTARFIDTLERAYV